MLGVVGGAVARSGGDVKVGGGALEGALCLLLRAGGWKKGSGGY